MTQHNTREEQQLIKLLKDLPFADETRTDWVNRIETGGISEELVDEIYAAFAGAGAPDKEAADLMQQSAQFTRMVRQWRLAQQTKTFKKH